MGQRLTEKTGVPVTAGITGEVQALKAMGLHRLVVATPHEDALNARMKSFLEASGFDVLKIEGYGVRKNSAISDLPVHASYKIAKRLYAKAPEADGIFIPCPRWPTVEDVEILEHEIGKPVVTSCQAYIWYALKLIQIKEAVTGYGQLMDSLAS
jgi:maleate isomerase